MALSPQEVKVINWDQSSNANSFNEVLTTVLTSVLKGFSGYKPGNDSQGPKDKPHDSGGGFASEKAALLEELRKLHDTDNYADDSWTRMSKKIRESKRALQEYNESKKELNDLVEDYERAKGTDDEENALRRVFLAQEKYNKAKEDSYIASIKQVEAVRKLGEEFEELGESITSGIDNIKKLCDAWGKADQAAADYAKSAGMSAKGYAAVRDNTINNVVKSRIGIYYDTSADELLKLQQNYADALGRNIGVNNEGQASLAAMSKMMGDAGLDMITKFENFGMSMNDAALRSGKMFKTAGKYGLDFKQYSKNVLDNITIAQNYTFKNGIRGLESMARKATAIKLDMKQIATFAEKVQTVEGAMEAASKLQVLGGSFSSLADPIGMLNEGLNDMEGLTDRVTSMIKGMGHFNRQTGEVEVSSFNKQRIRAAASAMGMDYNELMTSVNRGATREEIDRQLHVSGRADLPEDMKELIRNTGVIENGKAGVNINGEFKTLDQLEGADYDEMIKQGQSEGEDIKEICRTLRGWNDSISGAQKQRDAVQAKMTGPIAKGFKEVTQKLGNSNGALWTLVAIQSAQTILQSGGKIWGAISNLFTKFKLGGSAGITGIPSGAGGGGTKILGGIGQLFKGGATVSGGGSVLGPILGSAALAGAGLIGGSLWLKARDKRIAEGRGRKGDTMDYLHTMGGNAVKGAGIGAAIAGPVGAAVGTAVGALWGVARAGKRKQEGNLETALKKSGVEVQGKYKVKEMKAITSALANGNLDDKTRAKLLAQGDGAILDQIDKRRIKEGKIAEVTAKPTKSNGNEAVAESQKSKKERETKSDINLNIAGTLKLEGENGKSVDITKELMAALKDPTFINRTLIPTIMKGINNAQYGASVPSGINNYRLQPTV